MKQSQLDANIPVVVSADDNYAMPLAVGVLSMLESLESGKQVHLFVLDGGISNENRRRCEDSWGDRLYQVDWIQPDPSLLAGYVSSVHFTISTYFRIFIAKLLPDYIQRVIYTDPDVLFRKSIASVFETDLDTAIIAATQDAYCPFIDNRIAMPNYVLAQPYVYGLEAIPDRERLRIPSAQPYFNAGFLLIDLGRFRQERVGEQLHEFCKTYRDRLLWADQCALNACLGHRWLTLDSAWNVTTPVFNLPDPSVSCYSQATFTRIRSSPAMVHFAGPKKPWQFGSDLPLVSEYFDVLDRTSWAGWRPSATLVSASPNSPVSAFRNWLQRWADVWPSRKAA